MIFDTYEAEGAEHFSDHAEHEESVLCLLDVNALFYAALNFNVPLITSAIQNSTLIFDLSSLYLQISTIYLSSLDPPPRIYA